MTGEIERPLANPHALTKTYIHGSLDAAPSPLTDLPNPATHHHLPYAQVYHAMRCYAMPGHVNEASVLDFLDCMRRSHCTIDPYSIQSSSTFTLSPCYPYHFQAIYLSLEARFLLACG